MRQRWAYLSAAAFLTSLLPQFILSSPVLVGKFLTGGSGRNIRHLPCVSRKTGETGVCMFAFTCAKANGTHLGTCIDRFYFGSCCKINEELELLSQDNIIDVENTLTLSKPYDSTTTIRTVQNNILGTEDDLKPFSKPTIYTEDLSIKIELTTASSYNPTKIQFSKGTVNFTDLNTGPTKFSNFQTTKKLFEQDLSTLFMNTTTGSPKKWATTPKPRPTSTSTFSSSLIDNIVSSSTNPIPTTLVSPILFSIAPNTSPISISTVNKQYASSKNPFIIQKITKSPAAAIGIVQSELVETTKYADNIFTHTTYKTSAPNETLNSMNFIDTQQVSSSIRVPHRNTTMEISLDIISTSKPTTTTNLLNQSYGGHHKPLTTKKTTINKKPFRTTTKRSSTTKRYSIPNISRNPIATSFVTKTNVGSTNTVTNFSNFDTSTHKGYPNISTNDATSTPIITFSDVTNNNTNVSNTVSTEESYTTVSPENPSLMTITRKPLISSTINNLKTTTKPKSTTSKINLGSSFNIRQTAVPTQFVFTTEKPLTTFSKNISLVNAPIIITTNKPVILQNTGSISDIKKTTEESPLSLVIDVKSTVASSTESASKLTSSPTESVLLFSVNGDLNKTTVEPQTLSFPNTISTQNVISSSLNTSTVSVSNEVDTEFGNQTEQMHITPGIITWTSIVTDIENSTKNLEYSSTISDSSMGWEPMTTPEGWIIIHQPTTQKHELEIDEAKPVVPTTENYILPSKPLIENTVLLQPTTEMTLTPQSVTQPNTIADVLSTLASITLSSEFTNFSTYSINMSNFKEVCGRRLFPEPRIVGGDESTFGKWPWQISLRQWRTSTYLHKCGAALLNENWAITAAHCVQNVLPTDLLLRIGEHDLANEEEPYGFQERRVQIVASHPNFDPRTFEFDLALMRFYEPILPFQPNVLPICVPDDDEDFVGQTAFVTGWGRLYEDGPLPSVLQEVAVPVINNSLCEGMYRNAGYIEHIPHIFICAGWRKGGFDSCEGDSGGPLVIQRKRDGRWILAGVISWGIGCAEPNQPGVYTRISEFREWINQILQF